MPTQPASDGIAAQPASDDGRIPVSVVIATYRRPAECRRAAESVLAQTIRPREVVVCDDGSPPAAAHEVEAWCAEHEDVRYVGLERNYGSPGPARNAGIRAARGDWIALLDDDDRWLPDSLERRWAEARSGRWDVVAGDALLASGGRYFDRTRRPAREPTRAALHAFNPVIVSTALVRRDLLVRAGGFPTRPALASVADYAMWLALADLGARFLVLEEALVVYDDAESDRLSSAELHTQLGLALLTASRWLAAPRSRDRANAAFTQAVGAARMSVARLTRRRG